MQKKIIWIFFQFIFITTVKAQVEPIDTDRPDQTESVFLVPDQWMQFEFGLAITHVTSEVSELLVPTLLSRYGISKKVELRLLTSYTSTSHLLIPTGTVYERGFTPVEIGTKVALLQPGHFLPQVSLIAQVGIPGLSSPKYKINKPSVALVLALQNELSENFALGYNLGAEWDGIDNSSPSYIYTLSPGLNFGKRWYGYIETFGSFRKHEAAQHNIDGGVAYYISNNSKIDFSSGFGVSPVSPDWYVSVGFSTRFKLK
ncbi:MAG: transporter [Ginsengibacter sp.]